MERVTTLPRRPLTVDDLELMPDDGHRYELVDGTLIVSPSPSLRHQIVLANLMEVLLRARPQTYRVLSAPLDVVLADDTSVQPDLLVVRSDLPGPKVTEPPALAVEILSSSSRLIDLNLKRARYEGAGVPAYWVVDPDELRIVAWELRDGTYVEVAQVVDDALWTAERPFPVSLDPRALAD
jgi:Uma2 family endonuclease